MTHHDRNENSVDDTSLESRRIQIAALRRMSIPERIRMMDHLTALARSVTIEGIRRRHPGETDDEIQDRYSELVLGKELAAKVREHRRARKTAAKP